VELAMAADPAVCEPGLIQSALQRKVDFARYWQEPDGEDRLAALPDVAAAPDWALVAREWDAIHLPVSAYLEIAGRAIEVAKQTASVVAGWDPDTSIWLAGAQPASAGAPQRWQRDDDDGWFLTS
jgi:hypothetical protein